MRTKLRDVMLVNVYQGELYQVTRLLPMPIGTQGKDEKERIHVHITWSLRAEEADVMEPAGDFRLVPSNTPVK